MTYENSLITHSDPKSPISESYRVLRTNIQFTGVDKCVNVIALTSSGPGEGKTTVISNLAITFAQSGSKVLLIDADMRKPRVHKVFHLSNNSGLTTVLAQKVSYKECVCKTDIDNISILTSGPIPPYPSELLSSNAMKNLLEELRNDFDIILVDTPPVGVVTDAAIVSTIVDGTILVASCGQVEIDAIKRAKESLQKVNANLLGVVLNKVSKQNQGSSYSYYYYYSDEDDNKKVKSKRNNKI